MKIKLVAIILTVAMFVGCGSTATPTASSPAPVSPSTSPSASTMPAPAETTPAPKEEVELKIMSSIQTEAEAPLEQAMADAFMKANPNIKITFIPQKVVDLQTKIMALNISNELPDAFYMPAGFMSKARSLDITIDAREYMSAEFKASVPDTIMNYSVVDDRQMMVPWFIAPQALIYRSDWLKESGLGPIATMDDFVATAKAFTNGKDRWGFSMLGINNGSATDRFSNYARVFGVEIATQDANGKWSTDLTSDNYVRALQSFVDLDLVHKSVPPGSTEVEYSHAVNYFAQEKTGLFISGSNAIGAILKANPNLVGKIASTPIPKDQRYNTNLQGSGYAITTSCKNPKEMVMYLEFLTKPENAIPFGTATGRLPIVDEGINNEAFQTQEYKGFTDSIPYATPYPKTEKLPELLDIMGESFNSMLSGVSREDAMAKVAKRTSTIFK